MQIRLVDALIQHVPAEQFIRRSGPHRIVPRAETVRFHGLLERIFPCANVQEHRSDATVSAGKDGLHEHRVRPLRPQMEVVCSSERVLEILDTFIQAQEGGLLVLFMQGFLCAQAAKSKRLERCPRLGHKAVDREQQFAEPPLGSANRQNSFPDFLYKLNKFIKVSAGLGGQADHDVELEGEDACLSQGFGSSEQVFLGQALVDHLAEPLRAAVRGNSHRLELGPGQQIKQARRNAVGSEGGEGQSAACLAEKGGKLLQRL